MLHRRKQIAKFAPDQPNAWVDSDESLGTIHRFRNWPEAPESLSKGISLVELPAAVGHDLEISLVHRGLLFLDESPGGSADH
jgi:hypothetical protein